jgi:ankyrin repeat protein
MDSDDFYDLYIKEVYSLNKNSDNNIKFLYLCAITNDLRKIQEFYFNNKININYRGKNNETPLINACKKCFNKTIDFLIKNGANINDKDNTGKTPLMYVLECNNYKNLQNVMLLIEYGANINDKDDTGKTPLMFVCKSDIDVKRILKIIEILTKEGADVNIKDKSGKTALKYVLENNSNNTSLGKYRKMEIIELLLSYGADPNEIIISNQYPRLLNSLKNVGSRLINKRLEESHDYDTFIYKLYDDSLKSGESNEYGESKEKSPIFSNFGTNILDSEYILDTNVLPFLRTKEYTKMYTDSGYKKSRRKTKNKSKRKNKKRSESKRR